MMKLDMVLKKFPRAA